MVISQPIRAWKLNCTCVVHIIILEENTISWLTTVSQIGRP